MSDARVFFIVTLHAMMGDFPGGLYMWGGEHWREGGRDCSGTICDALERTAAAWPWVYDGGRTTAQGLHDYFVSCGRPVIHHPSGLVTGMLAFYRRPAGRIFHVAAHVMTVPDMLLTKWGGPPKPLAAGPVAIESGGAGSDATTPRQALRRSAGLRWSDTDGHAGTEWVAVDPFNRAPTGAPRKEM